MRLGRLWYSIQSSLFPFLEEELGELDVKQKEFVRVCELCALERLTAGFGTNWMGRPPESRLAIAKAFIAKAVYNLPTTTALIDYLRNCPTLRRLCGWEYRGAIPSESTFSRAFAEFAETQLPTKIHKAMIADHYAPKLAGHVSRDSSAVKAREKAARKSPSAQTPKDTPKPRKKRGRPRNGEKRPAPPPTKLQVQLDRALAENLADLPTACDWGCKRDSNGKKMSWKGYKLHLDVVDGDIPVSALVTSASVHDSQAAIPLAQMTDARIHNLYDLMDAAYDAEPIHQMSRRLGHVPIIDHNPRRGEKREMDLATARRYNERSSAERAFSNLENYGSKNVRVRGHAKVLAHLMFGVLTMTAHQLFNLLL